MAAELRELLSGLKRDHWREKEEFSTDMLDAQAALINGSTEPVIVLNKWLQRYQPCLFGRVAAKLNLIRYCILQEEDLTSDDAVRNQIQDARIAWLDDALNGKASAFIIVLISERLAYAVPDGTVRDIAHRICALYLRDVDVQANAVHHERVALEKPGSSRLTWEWLAGVNYFSAQGDKRWWQDHRIPGGMAFSVNSVGHMAKSGKMSEMMNAVNAELGGDSEEFAAGTIRSLSDALTYAMKTIDNASEAVSGKATELLPLATDDDADALPTCPIKLPASVADKNHCVYAGWYHTDQTLPDDYFRADVQRPRDVRQHKNLDFSYLFVDDLDNPAFESMGIGRRVRAESMEEAGDDTPQHKSQRMVPIEVGIDDRPLLQAALARRKNRG